MGIHNYIDILSMERGGGKYLKNLFTNKMQQKTGTFKVLVMLVVYNLYVNTLLQL